MSLLPITPDPSDEEQHTSPVPFFMAYTPQLTIDNRVGGGAVSLPVAISGSSISLPTAISGETVRAP
jgi:hypothetical protein